MATSLVPVDEALRRLLDGAEPVDAETVALADAAGRVLAEPVTALRTQPPFPASAMDGYAVRAADLRRRRERSRSSARRRPARRSAARSAKARRCASSPARRCRTAPTRSSSRRMRGASTRRRSRSSRRSPPAATSAAPGSISKKAKRCSSGRACSMRRRCRWRPRRTTPTLPVVRRPLVAIIATGDELLPPGSTLGPGQIIASNAYGVAAIARAAGAEAIDLGIVPRPQGRDVGAASAKRWTPGPTSSSRSAAPRSATTIWCTRC